MDTFSKSDPFFIISKAREGGQWAPVVKSEVRPACFLLLFPPFLVVLCGQLSVLPLGILVVPCGQQSWGTGGMHGEGGRRVPS